MLIAQNLRKFRIERSVTQEELAERIGVSGQAVSKWERGECYPDITLLPGLANFFGVTVDRLIGMEEISHMDKIGDVYTAAYGFANAGKYDEAIAVLEDSMKLFPNEFGFMCCYAQAMACRGEVTERTVKMLETVAAEGKGDKIRATATAALCFLYDMSGEKEKAVKLSKSRPHVREARELLHPKFLDKTEREEYLCRWLPDMLKDICYTIRGDFDMAKWGNQAIFTGEYGGKITTEEALEVIRNFLK
jgi:transcriptional regulator with XRE-family HTH domain